jgi:hypothetical protein
MLGFVFVAGEDNRVRAWSLNTRESIFCVIQDDSKERQRRQDPGEDPGLLALKKFTRPVNGLVLSSSGNDLWVASGRGVFCLESSLPSCKGALDVFTSHHDLVLPVELLGHVACG